jgi:Ornithine cyclodeaminase/mu-crystallin family
MLSRTGSRTATVIGAGVQGREHVRLLPMIRDFERINVCSLHFEDAKKLAAGSESARATTDVEAAVRESDVVCLAAHSPTPVIRPEWVKRGTHVSSVGYCPPNGELRKELARGHRLLSRRSMLFSRLRLVAANSRVWISPWEQHSVQWFLVGSQADLAIAKSPYIRLWVSPWRIWSLPISLTRGPSEKVVEE